MQRPFSWSHEAVAILATSVFLISSLEQLSPEFLSSQVRTACGLLDLLLLRWDCCSFLQGLGSGESYWGIPPLCRPCGVSGRSFATASMVVPSRGFSPFMESSQDHTSPPDPFLEAADSSGTSVPFDALLAVLESFVSQVKMV